MAADVGLVAERRFRAMGTDAHVVVNGPEAEAAVDTAVARVADLERRWSRFLEHSEISRLNAASGQPVVVSVDTFGLIENAVFAWQLTGGAFDPTMLSTLEALGYDRTFASIDRSGPGVDTAERTSEVRATGAADIELDRASGTVMLPQGVCFDPGGIGKGVAADLVTGELVAAGAWGAMVNLGGDLRVRGVPPDGLEWVISVREPAVQPMPLATLRLQDGAVATSTTLRRRWTTTDGERHHLLDPRTCLPHVEAADLVTVLAGEAWWAEVCATALIGDGDLDLPGQSALLVYADGRRNHLGSFERHTV